MALGLVCAPSPARAGVWFTPDLEVVALGQAGAFVAAPTTLSAAWYNPAGLAKQRGFQAQLEAGLIYSPLTYELPSGAQANNISPFLPAGLVGVSYDFTVPNLAIGVVAYVPQSSRYGYDPDGEQRFQSISGTNLIGHFHAMAAYRFFDRLSVGVACGPTYFSATQLSAVSAALFGDPTDPAWTVLVKTSVQAPVLFSGTVGLSAEVAPWMVIGASVTPGFDVKAKGTIDISLPSILTTVAEVDGSSVVAKFRLPTIVRGGVRVFPVPMLGIEATVVFENWSTVRAIRIEPDVAVEVPVLTKQSLKIGALTQTKPYRDLVSVRLGLELKPVSWLVLRAGGFVETSGSDPQAIDINAPEGFKIGVTTGVSFQLGRLFSIDAAYAHTFVPPVTVSDSRDTVQNVLVASNTKTIGNGVYRWSFDMAHLGVRFRWSK